MIDLNNLYYNKEISIYWISKLFFKSNCRSKQKWLEILANEIEEDDKR